MTKKQVLLCDADGTILDSEKYLIDATNFTVHYFGAEVSQDKIRAALMQCMPLRDFYGKVLPHIDVERCVEVHITRQRETFRKMVEPFNGVHDTLRILEGAGVKFGIVTSRRFNEPLLTTLRAYNLDKFFMAIISASDVKNAKPDPEGISLAMKMLGVDEGDKGSVFIVGDAVADMQAGKNAGIKTIGALYGFAGEELRKERADEYIYSFTEILDIVPWE